MEFKIGEKVYIQNGVRVLPAYPSIESYTYMTSPEKEIFTVVALAMGDCLIVKRTSRKESSLQVHKNHLRKINIKSEKEIKGVYKDIPDKYDVLYY